MGAVVLGRLPNADTAFFGHDDVVQDSDSQQFSGFRQLLRDSMVLSAGRGVTAGTIVNQQIAEAESRIAGRNTSRGCTKLASKVPTVMQCE